MKKIFLIGLLTISCAVNAWDAKVTRILQHGNVVAVYLDPDPGKFDCEVSQPFILPVDDTPAQQQKFTMVLTALVAGNTITGHDDECSNAIWGISRPTIRRVSLNSR